MGDRGSHNDGDPAFLAPNFGDATMPIAVIGMGCRYPGGATDPEKLWKMCAEQRDAWSPVPKERFNQDAFYHPDPSRNGTSNVKGAHFLDQHPGFFDAQFFNLTHAEATAMDPQQRNMLECAYEALENAGLPLQEVVGSDAAVFMATSCQDYADLLSGDLEKTELYQATGTGQTMLANRISYFFDLKGPSVTVDTACSSSLVALHLACNAIRTGESRSAIVGGSNLILDPTAMISLSMLRLLSPDGRCYTFDDRGNGFGRGEGVGCIVLKPLEEALKAGDTIRAIIRNSGTNQDGKTNGITLPSGQAQVDLIDRLYRSAKLDPSDTSYVEAHGTGTAAGDPIEAASLSKIFSVGRSPDEPLKVGSIKSNVGHLEGGSGMAGVIKTILMLERAEILPNFDFRAPNPRIPFENWKLEVPTTVRPWRAQKLRRVSINNFGFGGSNAHAILDDASSYLRSHDLNQFLQVPRGKTRSSQVSSRRARLFPLSAFDEAAGKRQMELLLNYLEKREVESDEFLDDLAFTLGERRSIFPWRATVSAFSPTELIEALSTENFKFSKAAKSVATGFVFTGQGAQWPTMGKELVAAYPVFKNSLLQSEGYLRKFGAPRSLLDELLRDVQNSRIGIALFSQPLCTALQIALVDLLATWNIRPVSVTGHSSGEIAAAYAAGALTQESALAAAYYRGVASTSIKDVQGLPLGAMLAVGMSKEEADEMISKLQKGIVNVACVNSPNSVTVSGDSSAIDELEEMVKSKGVFARKLAVDTAYHSHHMKPVAESYLNALGTLKAGVTEGVEFYSSVTGKRTDLSEHSAAYWVANLVSPVLFSDSIQNLCLGTGSKRRTRRGAKTAVDILIEVGPHSALSGPIKQNLQSHPQLSSSGIEYLSVLTRSKDAVSTSLALAGTLFRRGVDVNLHSINCPIGDESNKVLVDLPPYPWNHSKLYWARALDFPNDKRDDFPRSDILGLPARFSSSSEPQWRNVMRTSEIPWIQDHNIQGNTVCPAACFLAMAIEAAHQRAVKRGVDILGYRLREVTIGHALILSQDDEVETLLSLRPYNESNRITSDSWDEFVISSSTDGKSWTEHCRGLISVTKHSETTEVDGGRETQEEKKAYARIITDFNDACTTEVGKTEIYEPLSKLGLNFGPIFANMSRARSSDDKCVAEVLVPDTAAVMPANFEYSFVLHPATLDSFIHAVFPVGSGHKNIEQGTPVPTFIEEMYVSHNTPKEPQHKFTVYAKVEWKDLGNSAIKGLAQTTNSLSIFDAEEDNPMPAATITGLRFSSLPRPENQTDKVAKIAHKIVWEVAPDFMSAAQLKELTAPFRHSPKVKDQGRMIQQVAFYYAEQALKEVSLDQVSSEITHLKKLHQVLGHFCETVRNGHMGLFDTSSWLDLDTAGRTALCNEVSQTSYGILCYIGERLPQILRNEVDPLSLMMEEGRLEKHYRENQVLSQCYEQAAAYAALLANKNPFLNVLEIGAGTGGATFPILDALNGGDGSVPRFANYDFTDISAGFFEKVVDKTKRFGDLVKFKKLDIESGPAEQGFQAGSYDLIIAANVLHATKAMKNTLKRVRSLLKPGGSLILIEITISNIATSLIFGTLPGWWAAEEESRKMGPLLTEVEWDTALREADFNGLDATLWDTPDAESHHSSTMIATARAEDAAHFERNVTIVTEAGARDPCVEELQGLLGTLGINTKVSNLISIQPENQVCVVMSELTDSVLRNPTSEEFLAMKSIFLQSAGVLWVTRGALIASPSPSSNLVTGLTRTVRAEKGDTMLVNLDLDPKASLSGLQDAEAIFSIFKRNFAIGSVEQIDLDAEYAVRDGLIMIPRVVEDSALTTFVASATVNPVPEMQPFLQDGRSLRAEIKTPGFLDSLQFIDDERMSGPLPDDHVEIEVKAIGMNFRDVMSASGQIDPYPLGCECSGVVTAIGKAVNGLSAGDQVIANVIGGCVCNRVRTAAVGVEHVPKDMPFEIAASLPIVYFTAYYAVMKVARLSKGETVLIHAASGGLGQAIINLCQLVGAEIYATVGTIEKKKLLMDRFGIAEDHIFSSRDGTFAKGIMRMTGGGGVDVIMNSVSGDALRLTWNCIAPFGRFIELGKRDMTINSRLEMRHFEKNVSFTGLDVPLHTHFDEKRRIWGELMSMYQKGEIKPPYPITTYGISETEKALRIMQTGKHTGKLVLVPRAGEIVKVIPQNIDHRLPRADASYLLIGGLGGIGRAIALWMIEWGARNLIFVSPSGLDKEKAKECVEMLKDKGASVSVFKGDAAKLEDVDRVLENVKSLPPIRGVVNAAMVPKADLFVNLTRDDYLDTMRPKVNGTWNLHKRLSRSDLDFFLLLSSQVGALGNASQAAYSAGNVFLDAFADFRNSQGLPAVALDLGRVVGVGFVAENEGAQRGLNKLWSRDIDPDELKQLVKSAIINPLRKKGPGSSITGMKPWAAEASPIYLAPFFSHYRRAALKSEKAGGQDGATGGRIREMLKGATSLDEAAKHTCEVVIAKMSNLLMIPFDDISPTKSMADYGMDSLVAVEMRNWLIRELDATMPILELLANVSLLELCKKIVKKSKHSNPAILEEG